MHIYLKEEERVPHPRLVHSPDAHNGCTSRSQEPETVSRSPQWAAGTHAIGLPPVASQDAQQPAPLSNLRVS